LEVFFLIFLQLETIKKAYLKKFAKNYTNISKIITIFASCMKQTLSENIIEIKNKKASFLYYLTQEYTAGIVLCGSEIKSVRAGKANLSDAWCTFINGELWVNQMHIAEYRFSSYGKFNTKRDRKLLMTKRELRKLEAKSNEKGYTIVPTMLFVDKRGYAKLQIALARGKHAYDKRDSIKDRDIKRDIDRQLYR
jgi:SsrA-binding protein